MKVALRPGLPAALCVGSKIIADALADRGYSLVIHYRSSATEANEAVVAYQQRDIPAIALQADLTREEAEVSRSSIARLQRRFGRLDVLVNCAAAWKSRNSKT
ncbi:MAG: SDR family oxidoreductase [Gemmataceae bacterium]